MIGVGNLETKSLDHLGIVAGVCEEIGLVKMIDGLTDSDPQRKVSVGQGIYAMVLNGLGFVNQTLYLTPDYFNDKAVEVLFGGQIKTKDLNSHSLGSSLDALWKYDISKIFFRVSLRAVKTYGVKTLSRHLDGTNFAVHGDKYQEGEVGVIELKRGHHKQERHDLRLFVLELICSNEEGIPLFLKAASGNQTDKTEFPKVLQAYKEEMHSAKENWDGVPHIADSAFYTADTIKSAEDFSWLSRVPNTIKKAHNELAYSEDRAWINFETQKGYKYQEQESNYAGVSQRWLIVWSENGYRRSAKAVERRVVKQKEGIIKEAKKLKKQIFESEQEARQGVQLWYKELKDKQKSYYELGSIDIKRENHYGRGRRKSDAPPKSTNYHIEGIDFKRNEAYIEAEKQRKAKFILATNELDKEKMDAERILKLYKNDQQQVERGFRFLKDPMFLIDHIFLKLPRRIMALSMVMGLCLLVYTLAQYKLRKALKDFNESLPNQLKKPTQRPTIKWIFMLLKGIHAGYLKTADGIQAMILNLKELHIKILKLMGETTMGYYKV